MANRLKPAAAILVFLLAGCGTQQALREPVEAYAVPPVVITDQMVIDAKGELKLDPASPETARARYILARREFTLGKYAEMERTISQLEKNHPVSPWLAPAAYLTLLAARENEGALKLLEKIEAAIGRFPDDPVFRDNALRLAMPALETCTRSDLETCLAGSPVGPATPYALLMLAKMEVRQGVPEEALRVLRLLVVKFPSSPPAPEAFALIKELSKNIPVNPRKIGAILPMTGKYAGYGASVTQGITLALEDMAAAGNQFEFVTVDTAEDPEDSMKGLDSLVKDQQVIAAFGPLFSASALICAAEANALGVPLLTPSALDAKLTTTGPYVFRVALTPDAQAKAMAGFVIDTLKYTKFGILAPESAYGRNMAAAFTAEITKLGGTVLVESRFPPQTTDFRPSIVEIGGADIVAYKEAEEEVRRNAQAELENFANKLFNIVAALNPTALSATLIEPTRVACLLLTPDPYTAELGQRLRAAGLANKTILILNPQSVTMFSANLTRADVSQTSALSSPEELALADLLYKQTTEREATLAILVSVYTSTATAQSERLECSVAAYDTSNAVQLVKQGFTMKRPLPPKGNRYGLEALYVPTPGSQLVHIVPQLVYHSIGLPILGSDTWDDESLRRKPEAITLPAFFTVAFWPESDRPETAQFTKRFRDKFAEPPDALAANAYDAARILMGAALKSDGTREGLRQVLSGFGPFEGATGAMTLGEERDADKTAMILKIEGSNVAPAR
jgi:ABC-type branched-subunit amino acid transport system substrate-binding protein